MGEDVVDLQVHGTVAPGFERARERFAQNFADWGEIGAACAVYFDGKLILDLWGGEATPGIPWRRDTLATTMSVGKGIIALATQILVSRGELDLDRPVAWYWPEFAENGKSDITVDLMLTHRAGLPWFDTWQSVVSMDDPNSFLDYESIVATIARSAPVVQPGIMVYHSVTLGWLLGEIVHRITGQRYADFVREEICEPLGLELYPALPDEHHARVARLQAHPDFHSEMARVAFTPGTHTANALLVNGIPPGQMIEETFNHPAYRRAETAASGVIGDARSLARMYALIANAGELAGVRLVDERTIERYAEVVVETTDVTTSMDFRQGFGYWFGQNGVPFAGNPRAYGAVGMGGATSFVDPDRRIGFGYTPNFLLMDRTGPDKRAMAVAEAVYACLDDQS